MVDRAMGAQMHGATLYRLTSHHSLARSTAATPPRLLPPEPPSRLASPKSRTVNRSKLLELLTGGVPYVFAAAPGAETRGVPTAHAAPPLVDQFVGATPYVWANAEGTVRGQAVTPLYPGAPSTAQRTPPYMKRSRSSMPCGWGKPVSGIWH